MANQEQAKSEVKYPVGLILIIIWVGFGMVCSVGGLPFFIANPVTLVGPVIITGFPATLFIIALVSVQIALFVGLIRRREWARKLCLGWQAYGLLNSVFQLMAAIFAQDELLATLNRLLPGFDQLLTPIIRGLLMAGIKAGALFGIALDSLIMWYLISRKRFFR